MPQLAWLPESTGRRIRDAVGALERVLGDRLEAVFLVGAALNPARRDRAQSPELIAVASSFAVADLAALSKRAHDAMRGGVRLRVVTEDELADSTDVFALELADWKDRHVLLAGRDVLGALDVAPEHLRHSLELALRGLTRRLRNRVLAGLATDGHADDPRRAVVNAIDRLVVIAHHGLTLLGDDPPRQEARLLRQFAERVGADGQALADVLDELRRTGKLREPLDALSAVMPVVDRATAVIDHAAIDHDPHAPEAT